MSLEFVFLFERTRRSNSRLDFAHQIVQGVVVDGGGAKGVKPSTAEKAVSYTWPSYLSFGRRDSDVGQSGDERESSRVSSTPL